MNMYRRDSDQLNQQPTSAVQEYPLVVLAAEPIEIEIIPLLVK